MDETQKPYIQPHEPEPEAVAQPVPPVVEPPPPPPPPPAVETVQTSIPPQTVPPKSKTPLILLVLLFLLIFGGAAAYYFLGISSKSEIVPEPTPVSLTSPLLVPSPTSTFSATPVPVAVPTDWKSYTATDTGFGVSTTMSLPPGFSFVFTGSEFMIQDDATGEEIWDYATSVFNGKDGIKNYYDGSSRREWYQKFLDNEFFSPTTTDGLEGDILSVTEHGINTTSYLEASLNMTDGKTETHYIFVQNNIIHGVRPQSVKSYLPEAIISKNIAPIFASLTSVLTK